MRHLYYISMLATLALARAGAAGKGLGGVPVGTAADFARFDDARLALVALAVEHRGGCRVRHVQVRYSQ